MTTPSPPNNQPMTTPTIEEIVAATGILSQAASRRLRLYKDGHISRELLFTPKDERYSNNGRKRGDWMDDDHTSNVRVQLDAIPGGTAWERANIPDRPNPLKAIEQENRQLVEEIMRRAGVSKQAAWQRIYYWRRTEHLSMDYLFSGSGDTPRQPARQVRTEAEEKVITGCCPVTGGCATRMTEWGFRRACRIMRAPTRISGKYEKPAPKICEACGGRNRPVELVIVELAAMTTTQTGDPASLGIPVPDAASPGRGFQSLARPERETSARGGPPLPDGKPGNRGHISPTTTTNEEDEHMAKRSDKMANCELCGQKAQLESSHNFNVCPTCFKVMQYTRNHPDKIAAAARMLGKDTELAQALGMSDGAATTTSEGAAQPEADELAALKRQAAELLGCPQDEIIQALRLTEATLRTIREVVEPEIEGEEYDSLPAACRALVARYHAVRDAEHDAAEDEARTVELETRLMEAEREQDRLRERLRERLKTCNDPTEDALLQWAIRKYQAGKITLQIEVQEEMEAAA